MCFIIHQNCKCCQQFLEHCLRCWNEFHNGKKDKDYIPPEYYGQSMMPKDVSKELEKMGERFRHNPSIKPDKNRKYDEGDYHH